MKHRDTKNRPLQLPHGNRSTISFDERILTPAASAAFTLIELIVVMFILAGVLAVSAPSLARFFETRTLNEEARRLMALTRAAHHEAISRGETMEVRIDPVTGWYELVAQSAYTRGPQKPARYRLEEDFEIRGETAVRHNQTQFSITFLPDGFIAPESPEVVRIKEKTNRGTNSLYLVTTDYRLNYEIKKQLSDFDRSRIHAR